MYVCLCHGVTETAIREAVCEGVRTLRELSFKTGCGTRCGSCATMARTLLHEQLCDLDTRGSRPELRVVSAA
jgi:bacterioferritin-associated ferredoxin